MYIIYSVKKYVKDLKLFIMNMHDTRLDCFFLFLLCTLSGTFCNVLFKTSYLSYISYLDMIQCHK